MKIQESKKKKATGPRLYARRLRYFIRIVADKKSSESINSYEINVGEPFTKIELVIDLITLGVIFSILSGAVAICFGIYNYFVSKNKIDGKTSIIIADNYAREQTIKCIYDTCDSLKCISLYASAFPADQDLEDLTSAAKSAKFFCESKKKINADEQPVNQTHGPDSPIISGNTNSYISNGGK